ncbi:MAG TPA: EAL domain-containing protein [Gammaproteobacteria bacterium]|nr:EAL domain-containing protein [Gammaproteobacteria bacterium]
MTASVLAVDDNATIRKAIAMRLGSLGFRVVTAADGPHALQAVEEEAFDLVLLDLKMPGMRGDEVLKLIRERYSTTQLPVIMLAASDDKQDIAQSLALGANDYVVKPGDLPVLMARINTQLSLKDAARRLQRHENEEGGFTLDQRFRAIYNNTPVTCFTLDRELRVHFANRFGQQLLGYRPHEMHGQPIAEFYAPADRALAEEYLRDALALPTRLHRWEIRRRKKSGELVWMRETARVLGHGHDALLLMTCEDIDDAYKLSEKLSYHASHDELTGVANRKMLEARLARVLESAHSEGSCHALVMLDVDQFKIVNDTCGHDTGDELLRQVARRLLDVIRKRDTLARIGSDEFALLLEDCRLEDAVAIADAARRALEATPFEWAGAHHPISASLGVVALDAGCETVMSALAMADTACYAAKDSGRNRLHVYQAGDAKVETRHGEMRWAARIGEALRSDRFELNLQEIAPIAGEGAGDHYELLIRMRDDRGGLILPNEFLPAAERYNLAAELDRWVIGHALSWLSEHPALLSRLHLCSINLSGQSFCNDEVLNFILDQIERHGVAPSKLCFEVTETAAISDIVQATRFICTLRERGCLFALDDFGSGFSSFTYLKSLPVDFVKIDGSFVRDIANDSIDLAMVKSINDIGHVMGKKTIAEFVEDENVLALLKVVGVDYAQGYEIGRPTPLSRYSHPDLND